MTKLLCLFVVVIGVHYGTSQEETTTVIPDSSPAVDFMNTFLSDTEAEIGQAISTILQDPEAIRNFLNNNGGTVLEFTKVFMQNVTDETSEIRQQILKDVILAGLGALSTEVGQTFVKDVTTNVLGSLLSNRGNGASSAISSLIGNNPLLSVFANSEATSGSVLGSEFDNFLKKYGTTSASSSASSEAVVNGDTSTVAS